MTLAERLVAIRGEYQSACAEAAQLRREAAARSPSTAAAGTDTIDAARLRDMADAISERASELKEQIAEIEAHLYGAAEVLADRAWLELRQRAEQLRDADTQHWETNPDALQRELRQLRAECLRVRAEDLARTYHGLAHQLVDTATQLRALGGLAERDGSPLPLRLDDFEIPLPWGKYRARNTGAGTLQVDSQSLKDTQDNLERQLSALLHG